MKYIGYYDCNQNKKENRNIVLSAVNKMNYIISAIDKQGIPVEVISASGSKDSKAYKGKKIILSDNSVLKLFTCLGNGNKLVRCISILLMTWNMFWYIMLHTKKNEEVLVYHSLGYMKVIFLLKKLKKFKMILEVEEIYGDVLEDRKIRMQEIRFATMADAYIFPTVLLDELINKKHKPSIIIHGTYQTEKDRKCKFNDGKIHCVYAGTLDPRKGGAVAAAAAAAYLTSNYHIHILGFGSENDKKNMNELIKKLAKETSCTITYDGCLSGEEYIKFIQKCDIGLSTQNPKAAFNSTSFPSKILSYMANGLRVVSICIPAIETSAIGDYMYYYENQTPEQIAEAITKVSLADGYEGRKIIDKLDIDFKDKIINLLSRM